MSSSAPAPPSAQSPSPSWLRNRTRIVIGFWSIIALGIPFWWATTTIQRLPLPTTAIQAWSSRAPCYLRPPIDLHVSQGQDGGSSMLADVAAAVRTELAGAEEARCLNVHVREGPPPADHLKAYHMIIGEAQPAQLSGGRTVAVAVASGDKDTIINNAVHAARSILALDVPAEDPRVVKFSPRYKLVFSLLNQNAAAGDALLEWEIEELLERYLAPLLTSLAPLHTFEVQTQIQYFAPLTINLHNSDGRDGKFVSEEDLKAFINPAGWNLGSSVTLDPTLNLVLYVPSPENRPLRIQTDRSSTATAFITPQRGGVVILNPEDHTPSSESSTPNLGAAFRLFEQQLRLLLGVPPGLPGAPTSGALARWQVDALVRRRLGEATRQSLHHLGAIVKLVDDIPNMRVGVEVQSGVNVALGELEQAREVLGVSSAWALQHASRAMEEASKAYFNPTMLALLYFPDEHKYTIYAPFFGPVAVPLLAALAKEVKAWKEKRRKARAVAAGEATREKIE